MAAGGQRVAKAPAFATLARDWVEPVLLPHLATHVCAPSRHGLCVIDLMTLLALVSTAVNQCFGRRTSDALSTLILEWIVASCGAAVDAQLTSLVNSQLASPTDRRRQRFRLGGGTEKKIKIFTKTWKTKKLQKNIEKIDKTR